MARAILRLVPGDVELTKPGVRQLLEDLDGVVSCELNPVNDKVDIVYDPSKIDLEDVRRALFGEGTNLQRKPVGVTR